MPEIKIFKMDDYTFYAGETAEDCIKAYIEDTGMDKDELISDESPPYELTDEDLEIYTILIEDENQDIKESQSFKARLINMIEEGEEFPCYFAGSES